MSPPLQQITSLSLEGRTALCRVDFNVPLSKGVITDDTRIRRALPTIHALREAGARVVLCSHLGRPRGKRVSHLSLLPAAARLAELLDDEVVFSHQTVGDGVAHLVKDLPDRGVMVLENLRYHAGEKSGDDLFARQLASLGDVFINDAFGAMHRAHASITGVPKHLEAAAGLLVSQEVDALTKLVHQPTRPFGAILGGAKVSDKIGVIEALSQRVDHLFIGGAMAYTFLAARGEAVGSSRVEDDKLKLAAQLIVRCKEQRATLHLPIDHIVAEHFAANASPKTVTEIPDGWMGLDIGPATVEAWSKAFDSCRTLFWNGPPGVFEWDNFAAGSRGIAEALASSSALTIVGGGDSAAAIGTFGLADRMDHVSTGGGASLKFLEHGDLIGLKPLRRK